ncbi:MAG: DUF1569 domain-containing protein [Flavobacteriales bacterium]|nr:DUF1569 domain-containing protein [Flavobacteriales bacterium]
MKNILDPRVLSEVNVRIDRLKDDTARQWGTMTPAQMLWHCRQQVGVGTGELKVKDMFPAPIRWLLKKIFAGRLPFGKGMATLPGIEAGKREGLDLEVERAALKSALAAFVKLPTESILKTHPIFGTMSDDDWGHIIYKHLDHHLRQFGL